MSTQTAVTNANKLRAFDADNHYYETRDAFTRHIDEAYRDYAVRPVIDDDGEERIYVGEGTWTRYPSQYDRTPVPGGLRTVLRKVSAGTADEFFDDKVLTDTLPAFVDRDARLKTLDEQGLEGCLLFPTLGVVVEHYMRNDPKLTFANVRAFNRWLEDDWGYAYKDRLFAVPILSLLDVDLAIAELERVLALGARAVHLRPGPQGDRSPADPKFDGFWSRIQEADVPVIFHSSESGYNEIISGHWSEDTDPGFHGQSAWQWTNAFGDRPIMDTLSALILHNLFGRFPGVRVATIENGSLWVPYLLKAMDKMKGMGRSGPWLGGRVNGRPSEIFKQHVWVNPFHEEAVEPLVQILGADRVLFGSDWPHAEGVADPVSYVDALKSLDESDKAKIMYENAHDLMGRR